MRFGTWPSFAGFRTVLGAPAGTGLKIWTGQNVTAANGSCTITFADGITAITFIGASVIRNSTDATTACFAHVRSYTATSALVQVYESKTTGVLLGGTVEGLEATAVANLPIMLLVIGT